MSRKHLKPRDKVTQRMTRDGVVLENQTTGEEINISDREAEQDFTPAGATGRAEKVLERAELAAFLTSILPRYTLAEVQAELQRVFNKQYTLITTTTVEVRYRTETRTDSEGNSYTVQVPYNYYILNVKLTARSIVSIAPELLTPEQLEMFNIYLETSGNNPLVFGGGSYDISASEDISGVHFVDGARPGNTAVVDIAK